VSFAVEHLSPRDSLIARFDPRWKLVALLIAAVLTLLLRSPTLLLIALTVTLSLVGVARLPGAWYRVRIVALLFALAPFALFLPLTFDQGPSWRWAGLSFHRVGFIAAGILIIRGVAVVSLMLVLLGTAPLHATARAARALGCPGTLVQIFLMSYRYIFLLLDELNRLRVALRVRGFRNRANRHSYRTAGQAIGTLIVRGADRAERVAHAMRCRGFDGHYRALAEFHTRPIDLLLTALITAPFIALTIMDRCT